MPGRSTSVPPRHLSAGTTGVRPVSSRMMRRSSALQVAGARVAGHGCVGPFPFRHEGEGAAAGALARARGRRCGAGVSPAAAPVVVLAAAEVALDPERAALAVHDDHGVVARRVAGPAEVVDRLRRLAAGAAQRPRADDSAGPARDAARGPCDNPLSRRGRGLLPKILIVDDEPGIRFGVRDFLESEGLEVEEAETVARRRAGRARLAPRRRRPRPHAARRHGARPAPAPRARSTRRCRWSCSPATRRIDLAVRAVKEGADQFLAKPVELPALLVMVQRLLESQREKRRQIAGRARQAREAVDPFTGTSAAIRALAEQARRDRGHEQPDPDRGGDRQRQGRPRPLAAPQRARAPTSRSST